MSSSNQPETPYCTHECLLGVKNSSPIDPNCPNASHHPKDESGNHTTTPKKMRDLTKSIFLSSTLRRKYVKQLSQYKQINTILLGTTGYKLITKCLTNPRYWSETPRHEEAVYKHIETLQGTVVPVCLGSFKTSSIDSYILLSYTGPRVNLAQLPPQNHLIAEAISKLHALDVTHGDLAARNITCSEDSERRIFLIDFEHAEIVREGVKNSLLVKREAGEDEERERARQCVEGQFEEEKRWAEMADAGGYAGGFGQLVLRDLVLLLKYADVGVKQD